MHIEQVAVIVDDYDEAIAFFVDALGFELVEDSPALTSREGRPKRWVVVRPPGATAALLLAKADRERQARAVGEQFAGRVGLFLRVADFDAAYTRMRDAGVELVRDDIPRDSPLLFGFHSGLRRNQASEAEITIEDGPLAAGPRCTSRDSRSTSTPGTGSVTTPVRR